MNCELSVQPGKCVVVSKFTGPIETADRYRNRDRTLAFCRQHGCSRVLVDTRGQIPRSRLIDVSAFAAELAREARGFRIAFVRDQSEEQIRFMDNVASNRGCVCRSFTSVEEAEQWLIPDDAS